MPSKPRKKPEDRAQDLKEIAPLGHEIQRLRVSKGLTLEALEAKTGIAKNTLSLYENHRVNPTAHNLLRIVVALDINLSELVRVLDHKPEGEKA